MIAEGYLYDAYGTQTVYAPGADGVVSFGDDDDIAVGGVSVVLNPFLFTGRRLDGETDLYYYRARYLDPEQGRFLQRDPIASESNLYLYGGNGPTGAVDPSGLDWKKLSKEKWEEILDETRIVPKSWYTYDRGSYYKDVGLNFETFVSRSAGWERNTLPFKPRFSKPIVPDFVKHIRITKTRGGAETVHELFHGAWGEAKTEDGTLYLSDDRLRDYINVLGEEVWRRSRDSRNTRPVLVFFTVSDLSLSNTIKGHATFKDVIIAHSVAEYDLIGGKYFFRVGRANSLNADEVMRSADRSVTSVEFNPFQRPGKAVEVKER